MHNFTYSDISSKIFESSSMLNSVTCKMFGGLLAFKAYFQFLPQHLSWSQMWALTRPLVLPHNPAFLLLFERFFGGFTSVSLKAPRHLLDRWPHIIFKHSLLWFRQTNQVPQLLNLWGRGTNPDCYIVTAMLHKWTELLLLKICLWLLPKHVCCYCSQTTLSLICLSRAYYSNRPGLYRYVYWQTVAGLWWYF